MTQGPNNFKVSDLGEALNAVAEIVRSTFAPLFAVFDESGLFTPTPAKKRPLIHNGRKPRK